MPTLVTMDSSVCAGDMAARLKAKLRTRAGGSSHVAAARGKQARAHRQKAARASEALTTGCTATSANGDVRMYPTCRCCAGPAVLVEPTAANQHSEASTDTPRHDEEEPVVSSASHSAAVAETSNCTAAPEPIPEPAVVSSDAPTTDATSASATISSSISTTDKVSHSKVTPTTTANIATSKATPTTADATPSSAAPTITTSAVTSNATPTATPASCATPTNTTNVATRSATPTITTKATQPCHTTSQPAGAPVQKTALADLHVTTIVSNDTHEPNSPMDWGPDQVPPRSQSAPLAHFMPSDEVPEQCTEPVSDTTAAPLSNIASHLVDINPFPTAESFSSAAGSILTSVIANYVITAVPVLMQTVFGQLTHDQVAQLLPALACSSGLVAVLSEDPSENSVDSRTALQLLALSQKRYPTMNIPADLGEAVEQDKHHARYAFIHFE